MVVPLIVGGDWFVGAASPAAIEKPATASTVTNPAPSSASREVDLFMVPLSELPTRLPCPHQDGVNRTKGFRKVTSREAMPTA